VAPSSQWVLGYSERLSIWGDNLQDRVVSAAGNYNSTATQTDVNGSWFEVLAAFKAGGSTGTGDSTAPTTPAGVTATAISSTQINLNWLASTDNVGVAAYLVERCIGAGCAAFSQVATPAGTTFSDTGLAASMTYQYRVRARDAANNTSAYLGVAFATTSGAGGGGDIQAPTVPGSVTASAVSTTQINLGWAISTDNTAVTGYQVERCVGAGCTAFVQIATPAGTTLVDTGLAASTVYRYRVRALDAAGNGSGYSTIATATTQAAADITAPSAPLNLTVTPGTTQMTLNWSASTDNVGVTGYLIERCQGAGCTSYVQIATVTTTSYVNTGLLAGVPYGFRIRATDAANNLSGYSGGGNGVMGECD
jgi:chitodextrinase